MKLDDPLRLVALLVLGLVILAVAVISRPPRFVLAWLDAHQRAAMADRQNERLRTEWAAMQAEQLKIRQAAPAAAVRDAGPGAPLDQRSPEAQKVDAQRAALQADQPELLQSLLDPSRDPVAEVGGFYFRNAQSDAMLQAIVGPRYPELRYSTVKPLSERPCSPAYASQPVVSAVVEKVRWREMSQRPKGGLAPSDLVTLRVSRVLNAVLLDRARLARATHALPGNRDKLPQVDENWATFRAGRDLEVAWPDFCCNLRLRSPPIGSRLILSIGGHPGSYAADPCLLADTRANAAEIERLVKLRVAYETDTLPTPVKPGQAMLMEGRASAPALSAGPEIPPTPASPADIQGDVILTELDVSFDPKATVGQVNAAIRAVHGSIACRERGDWWLTLHVPRANSYAELAAMASVVAVMPGIVGAEPARLPSTN